jgi:succinate dehydrogenase / fumarate reductase cytochrome b subunit
MAKKSSPKRPAPKRVSPGVPEAKEKAPEAKRRVSAEERPTSPHLSVYRWQITNGLSILNRITGAVLLVGLLLLAAWLISAALGEYRYQSVQKIILSPCGTFVMVGFTLAFYYHLLNGIRHLFWDLGWGFELDTVTLTGVTTVLATIALTAITWLPLLSRLLGM